MGSKGGKEVTMMTWQSEQVKGSMGHPPCITWTADTFADTNLGMWLALLTTC